VSKYTVALSVLPCLKKFNRVVNGEAVYLTSLTRDTNARLVPVWYKRPSRDVIMLSAKSHSLVSDQLD
jgi:hypothetical protein